MKFLLAKAALFSTQSYDVVLLQELWMRPDHETIRSRLPAGYWMSGEVREGTAGDWLFHLQRLETWLPQISVTAEFSPHSAPASPSSQTFPSSKIAFSRLSRLFQINADAVPYWSECYQWFIFVITGTSPSPPSLSTAISGVVTESTGLGRELAELDWSQRSTLLWTFFSALSVLRTPILTTDRFRLQSSERLSEIQMQILY